MKRKSKTKSTACRLDERDRQELEARAEKLNTTMGDLVKQYVIAGLRDDDAKTSIVAILREFKDEIRETRRDHALMAEVLLASAGKISRDEAHKWAEHNIRAE